MIKKYFFLAILTFTGIANAQNEAKSIFDRRHEVKVGVGKLLAGAILEGTYEYIQSRDFTYGASILANLDTGNDYYEDFSVTPFARFYFQETKEFGAKGFFVEGFGKYSIGRNTTDNFVDEESEKYTAAALGISLGKKWINRTGFVFEALFGIGRTLGNSNSAPDILIRGDLNLGYRF